MKFGLVGCGEVAEKYIPALESKIRVIEAWDTNADRMAGFCSQHGIKQANTFESLLGRPEIEAILVLTSPDSHFNLVRACLMAGKHVFCEKPLAFHGVQARELFTIANERGLHLYAAPAVTMGSAQQRISELLARSAIGSIPLVYVEANHWRLESRHPRAQTFFDNGILWDQGPYILTLLVHWFGPVEHVDALGKHLKPLRKDQQGSFFKISKPDFVTALLTFKNGTVARITMNFYAKGSRQGSNIEFIGEEGFLWMEHFQDFASPLILAQGNDPHQQIDLGSEQPGYDYGRGVAAFENQVRLDHRSIDDQENIIHVIDVLEDIERQLLISNDSSETQSHLKLQ